MTVHDPHVTRTTLPTRPAPAALPYRSLSPGSPAPSPHQGGSEASRSPWDRFDARPRCGAEGGCRARGGHAAAPLKNPLPEPAHRTRACARPRYAPETRLRWPRPAPTHCACACAAASVRPRPLSLRGDRGGGGTGAVLRCTASRCREEPAALLPRRRERHRPGGKNPVLLRKSAIKPCTSVRTGLQCLLWKRTV